MFAHTNWILCIAMAGALTAGCTSAPSEETLACTTPEDATAMADYTLHATDAVVHPVEGSDFIAWTYDGDVPGRVLRLALGEKKRVKLVNDSPRPASLHFHGVSYSVDDDGSPDNPKSMVNPGCAHVYTITAVAAGVWPFHSHRESRTEMTRGLYGAVIVPDPNEKPAAHEFVAFLGALGLEGEGAEHGEESEEEEEGGAEAPSFFMTINGRAHGAASVIEYQGAAGYTVTEDAIATAKVGDLVRFRALNVAPDDMHTFHLHGHRWCDGGGLPDVNGACPNGAPIVDNVFVAPAQGTSLEFIEDAPGTWMYHCHLIDHVNDGMFAYYKATN